MLTNEQEHIRLNKLGVISKSVNPYPDRFEQTHELKEIIHLPDGAKDVKTAGRIIFIRKMGKLCFTTIADMYGKTQIAIRQDMIGEGAYDLFESSFDIGDFLGVAGEIFTTRTGEKTIRANEITFLGKALRPLPEKFHGVNDIEICYRQRYLDLIMNQDSRERFLLKFHFIKELRSFLEDHDYLEIETPALINKASGALARPFVTHYNALDMDVYLSISPETYLKRAIIGGFTKVFEFARCFRNEGIDATHLQDFTMLECYCAYYNYKDNMTFTQEMMKYAVTKVFGSPKIQVAHREIDFSAAWEIVSFRELLLRDCGIDIDYFDTATTLLEEINRQGIHLESSQDIAQLGRGNLIDLLYKKVSRPKIIQPTFLTAHPVSLSPLARANDENPNITDRFQLIVNGAEVINAYSELVDPIEQNKRLAEQAKLNAAGDGDAMMMDKDYITAMLYGMPPISGWGLGIDRLLQVLTGEKNLKDYVLFPMMRPVD